MKNARHLSLEGCVLRLQSGDLGHEAASRQWEELFGIARSDDLLAFTNARLGFVPGREGQPEGIVSITVGVSDSVKLDHILERARAAGVCRDGHFDMCGVRWHLSLTSQDKRSPKL